MPVRKLNAAGKPTISAQIRFSFERQETETEEEYSAFVAFLNDDSASSPAKWIEEKHLDPELRYVANRNAWIQRRFDLWSHNAASQRNKWVELLDLHRNAVLERVEIHKERIAEARAREVEEGRLSQAYDRVVRTMAADLEIALKVVEALADNDDTRVTIFNQSIGSVLKTDKDVSPMQRSWDAVSQTVIEGSAKVIDAES